jgi:hypothetical protein
LSRDVAFRLRILWPLRCSRRCWMSSTHLTPAPLPTYFPVLPAHDCSQNLINFASHACDFAHMCDFALVPTRDFGWPRLLLHRYYAFSQVSHVNGPSFGTPLTKEWAVAQITAAQGDYGRSTFR